MIRRMRRKFVAIALASVALVLAVIVGGINIASYLDALDRADERLDFIAEQGGTMGFGPQGPLGPGGQDADQASDLGDVRIDDDYDFDDGGLFAPFGMGQGRMRPSDSPEFAFETRYFTVFLDDEGKAESAELSSIAAVGAEQAAALGEAVATRGREHGFAEGYRYLLTEHGDQKMAIFLDMGRELDSIRSFAVSSVVASLLGLAAVAALLVPLSRWVVRPVEESQERQRRFVTDASHELKTPLAIISSAVDVMEIEGGGSEWTESVRHQVARLSDLTEKLVTLSRADEDAAQLTISDFDLTATAEALVADFEPAARAADKAIDARIAQGLSCHGDQALVGQAISLMLDNAIKHSSAGPIVFEVAADARLGKGAGHALIRTENPVEPGTLSPGDHADLFDRFTRADEARSQSGGHGIGLAVVRAIAEAHGGMAAASVADDGGSISIELRV